MATFKANAFLLSAVLEDVAIGKVQLPDFQRGWVWDDARIKDLLVSISRGFPIGAVMTLDAGGDLTFRTRLIEGVDPNGAVRQEQYLLDGQQRLTSLYQALRYPKPVETRNRPGGGSMVKRWYYVDILKALDPKAQPEDTIFSVPEDRVIRSNFGRDIILDLTSVNREFESHKMPTESVMNAMAWGFKYAQYWGQRDDHPAGDPFEFFNRFNESVVKNFSEYQLPVINLGRDTSKEAVCTVFEKVNTGGVTLNVFELVTASFSADEFSLRDDWAVRRGRLHSEYGVLQWLSGDQFLQAVTLLATQARRRKAASAAEEPGQLPAIDCRRASILNLKLSEYTEWADRVEAGLTEAAQFLNRQFIFTKYNVPYNTQLVPLAVLSVELGGELRPANAQEKLERWFWCGVLGEAYGGSVETQFANDLVQVTRYVRDGVEPDLVSQALFAPERLLSLRTRNSAAYKGLYALQMKNGAADWSTAQPLSFTDVQSKPIDIHHIFPKHWCEMVANPAIPWGLCDSIVNKTPIDAWTNRRIGGRAPSSYLKLLRNDIDGDKLKAILQAHWIDPVLLEADRFDECFVERGQKMLDLIGQTMGKPAADSRRVFRDALSSAIPTEGEDDGDIDYDPIGESAYGDGPANVSNPVRRAGTSAARPP